MEILSSSFSSYVVVLVYMNLSWKYYILRSKKGVRHCALIYDPLQTYLLWTSYGLLWQNKPTMLLLTKKFMWLYKIL